VAARQALVGLGCCGRSRLGSAGGARVTKGCIPVREGVSAEAAALRLPGTGSLLELLRAAQSCDPGAHVDNRLSPITACDGASGPTTVRAEAVRMRSEQRIAKRLDHEGPAARHSFPRRKLATKASGLERCARTGVFPHKRRAMLVIRPNAKGAPRYCRRRRPHCSDGAER
jgi:hypothetical protein